MGDLSRYFSRHEFECSCGCGFDQVQAELVQCLERVRVNYGPLTINSGCRCDAYNRHVSGSPTSSHVRGLAVDLSCSNSLSRFNLLRCLLAEGFQRIGIGPDFIHVDRDFGKPRSLIWLY